MLRHGTKIGSTISHYHNKPDETARLYFK